MSSSKNLPGSGGYITKFTIRLKVGSTQVWPKCFELPNKKNSMKLSEVGMRMSKFSKKLGTSDKSEDECQHSCQEKGGMKLPTASKN
jgi:hypothetical protein